MSKPEKSIQNQDRLALITGASSGLGAEFARQLAKNGYDLIISARREDRLQSLKRELFELYGTPSEILPADLSTEQGIARLESRLRREPVVELLVNNAGFGGKDNFAQIELQRHIDMLRLHIEAPMRLTHTILPSMLANNYGRVINVSSISAFLPMRSVSYSATKVYLVNFSQALSGELAGKNIHIQALCPGFTITEFHDARHNLDFNRSQIPSWLWLNADFVVSESLRVIARRPGLCIPGIQYKLVSMLGRSPITSSLIHMVWRNIRKNR
jgi:hypothetical protein